MRFLLAAGLLGMGLAACGPAAAPVPTPAVMLSSTPPTQVRCIMARTDRALLLIFSSSPSIVEQSAIADNCIANGKMGSAWTPLPNDTPMDGYSLICEGAIAPQASEAVWALPSNQEATGRAYDVCDTIKNPTFPNTR